MYSLIYSLNLSNESMLHALDMMHNFFKSFQGYYNKIKGTHTLHFRSSCYIINPKRMIP